MSSKVFLGGLEIFKTKMIRPAILPRTAIIPVVNDEETGLNAGPVSGGIASLKPLQILFGIKNPLTMNTFNKIDEFSIAIPSQDQLDHMWVMACGVPKGISEIDIAGWHTLLSKKINTPGIQECRLNLECKKIFCKKLPYNWRTVVIGEVVGVSIDNYLLDLNREEVIEKYPMHEGGYHPETGLYAPTVLSGNLIPNSHLRKAQMTIKDKIKESKEKRYVDSKDLYNPENEDVLINSIFPMPSYFIITNDEKGNPQILPYCGGKVQYSIPAITITIKKDSFTYSNIKRTGEFVISVPDDTLIGNFEAMEKLNPDDFKKAGLSVLRKNMINVNGIKECPINIDCKVEMFEDVADNDYAIIVASKLGVSLNKEIFEHLNKNYVDKEMILFWNSLYSKYPYTVFDKGMERKCGFHSSKPVSVRCLPSWGSRHGKSWTGPNFLPYWLIELYDEGLLSPRHLAKIGMTLSFWNNGYGPLHLKEYFTDKIRNELRNRITNLFKKMVWAHRDYDKWDEVRQILESWPEPERSFSSGPLVHVLWNGQRVVSTDFIEAVRK